MLTFYDLNVLNFRIFKMKSCVHFYLLVLIFKIKISTVPKDSMQNLFSKPLPLILPTKTLSPTECINK